jgi:hypothetical protein
MDRCDPHLERLTFGYLCCVSGISVMLTLGVLAALT